MPAVDIAGSRWTSWFTFGPSEVARLRQSAGNQNMGPDFLSGTLYLDGEVQDPTVVEGEIALGGARRRVPITLEVFEKGFSIDWVLWRDANGSVNAGSAADFNQRYWESFRAHALPRSDRPKLFTIADRFDSGPDRRAWRDGLTHMRSIGINTAVVGDPRSPLGQLLDESGIAASGSAAYCPPGAAFDYEAEPGCVWNERATGFPDQAGLDEWANRIASDLRAAGFTPGQVKLFGIRDEPNWSYESTFDALRSSPTALERFRGYLDDQDLTPADLGESSWSEVYPLGRRVSGGNVEQRRLFYWSMRFFSWDSSRHHANSTAALQRAFPDMSIFTNWNNFSGRLYDPASPDPTANAGVSLGSHDWFEFGRLRGGTTLWTEDWFGDNSAYQWSYFAQRLWAAAKEGGTRVGAYVVGQASGEIPGGLTRKVMALVGHGGKEIFYYAFGPRSRLADGWSERSLLTPIVGEIAATNRLIAQGEDLLWPGVPTPSTVAVLEPRTAQMWDAYDPARPVFDVTVSTLAQNTVDYQADVRGVQLALQHANVNHEVISESQLNAAELARYKVLYVTEPNIPAAEQEAIASWVKSGGTLVKASGAGAYDRYNDPFHIVDSLGG
ncbi:MAG: hypothetical protein LC808_11160, partial [Actinobacteria bacterium]|nr:hypothetical protein [Actinomycetota bacterium]